ncbi:MAG: MATE family efflux transporter [Peptoniphilus sp.]|uniref:MATE family efflux transporter n=1 Tax=Peptoniphilus sp. TaxID=1971214 RepID=UPI0025D7D30F|nr:MATE family efflux transporter [Peptoniphilus sp.]MCI5643131.1 MATE family efflux transporter [Peptoniphilus sp.]MDD7352258.1 MATE family efflux transporter [Peptoniphilaceae bacterium]
MNLRRQFFKFVIPSIIAMWVFSIYTIVDGFFVANFAGELELSAVTIVIPYVNFLFAIAIITGVGSQTIIGIELGRGNRDKANKVFTFIIIFILAFAVLLSIFALIFMDKIILFLGADSNLFPLSHQYLSVIVFFSPFYIISYAFEVLVKVDGYPRTAILGAISACVTNIVLDYILIDKFQMGVKGAAFATGIAQFLSCVIFFIHFRSTKGYLRFMKIKMSAREIFDYLKTTIAYGFGEFISELNTATFVFIFNLFVIKYISAEFLSAYAVINYMSIFANSTFQGVCHGTLPLLSYYHGSQEREKSLKIIKMSFIFISIIAIIMYAISYFGAEKLFNMFLENKTMISSSIRPLRLYALMFFLAGSNLFIASLSSAIGNPKYSIIINIVRGSISLFISIYLCVKILGTRYLFLGAFVSEFIVFLISLYSLKKMTKNPNFRSLNKKRSQ